MPWIDVKTGKPIGGAMKTAKGAFFKVNLQPMGFTVSGDGERAFNPETGQNAAWDDSAQQWVDTKTRRLIGGPMKTAKGAFFKANLQPMGFTVSGDGELAFNPETGQNAAWEPETKASAKKSGILLGAAAIGALVVAGGLAFALGAFSSSNSNGSTAAVQPISAPNPADAGGGASGNSGGSANNPSGNPGASANPSSNGPADNAGNSNPPVQNGGQGSAGGGSSLPSGDNQGSGTTGGGNPPAPAPSQQPPSDSPPPAPSEQPPSPVLSGARAVTSTVTKNVGGHPDDVPAKCDMTFLIQKDTAKNPQPVYATVSGCGLPTMTGTTVIGPTFGPQGGKLEVSAKGVYRGYTTTFLEDFTISPSSVAGTLTIGGDGALPTGNPLVLSFTGGGPH